MKFRGRSAPKSRRLWEMLESRVLLSANHLGGAPLLHDLLHNRRPLRLPVIQVPSAHVTLQLAGRKHGTGPVPHSSSPPGGALTPSLMRQAYGMTQVMFGNIVGDGTGQTIAIIDAYDYPTAFQDLQAFDQAFGLPDPPSFKRVAQDGSQNFPGTDPAGPGSSSGTWEQEAALDVQWAHAMAPGASIILVEANNNSYNNLIQGAANWARSQPGVSVVTMSFGGDEFSGQASFDSVFATPAGHNGVTFVASTGDNGQPGSYPAYSPGVVALGGTSLFLNGSDYGSENGWNKGGGGISVYESQPSYQNGVVPQSSTQRTQPDLAMDADPNTGVAVYDSWDFPASPWFQVGGTSLAAPMFAGLVAVANQGRALSGQGTLDGRTETLPKLYAAPASDFHDITSGNNGFSAGPGYDLITGRGSPIADLLIRDLVGVVGSISGHTFQDNNANAVNDSGDDPLPGVTVYLDANNNGSFDPGGSITSSSGALNLSIPSNNFPLTSTQTLSGISGTISDVNVTLSIMYSPDFPLTATLIAPDGTQVTLFTGVGGVGSNFNSTTLDDQASRSIALGTAPFGGSFKPSSPLSVLNGKSAAGDWKLKITSNYFIPTSGKLLSWSLSVTTAPEPSTLSGPDGSFTFSNLQAGSYTVREVPPPDFTQAGPTSYTFNVQGDVTGAEFANVPPAPPGPASLTFTAPTPDSVYYLWLDNSGTTLNIGTSAEPANPAYQLALSSISSLAFNLTTDRSKLILDFSNGAPLPQGGIQVDGGGLPDSEIDVLGQYSTNPNQLFDMTDTQIGITGGPWVQYQNLGAVDLINTHVNYSGTLSTLQNLTIDGGTVLNWM